MSAPAPAAATDTCPRCGGGFHCGVNEGHCACFGLHLDEALKASLAQRYPGQCLCLRCLAALGSSGAEDVKKPC